MLHVRFTPCVSLPDTREEKRCCWVNEMDNMLTCSIVQQATFSTCLPHAEEAEFEEKFKYLIVTSSFINESSSPNTPHSNDTNNKKKKRRSLQHMASVANMDLAAATISNTRISRGASAGFGTVATMTGLLMALGAETIMLQQHQQQQHQEQSNHPLQLLASPVLSWTMLLTGGMSIFFVYRHLVS